MTTTETMLPSWINKGKNEIAAWIRPKMVGSRAPNGTFVIHTRVGETKVQARVLVGHIVINRRDVLYTCPPADARALVAEMDERDRKACRDLPKPKQTVAVAEADVAPRDDDTDDITRRIRGVDSKLAGSPRKSPAEPQKTAISEHDLSSKELGGLTRVSTAASTSRKPQKTEVSDVINAYASTSPRKWPKALGNPPSIENRNPSELHLDDSYQRSTDNGASTALIKRIANGWDWRMCLPLVVSKRDDGSLWVIDGQHRLAAAKMRGDIPFLPCCVGVFGSVADEAAMFVAMNRARKPMNRLDDFHAALAASDAEAIEILDLVSEAGLTISRNTSSTAWKPGEIAFTASIASTVRKHGRQVASAALTNIAEAFPGQRVVHSGSIFLGLVKVLVSPPEGFDPDRMFQALMRYSAEDWGTFLTGLKGGDTRAAAIRDALLMAYDEVAADEVAG